MTIDPADDLAVALPPKAELRPLASLRPARRNARTHSDRQIAQIMASIDRFGFTNPILVDQKDHVVAGHGRLEAARRMGITRVPVIPLTHLSPAELRAYALADNKLAENAGWDPDILRVELEGLLIETSLDIELTGFSTTEIDLLVDPRGNPKPEEAIDPEDGPRPWVRRGDLWILGKHRLLCGDARDPEAFHRLMGDERARMVFSDPPYNVRIDGHVGGLGAIRHPEFAMASGEMSPEAFTIFLRTAFENAADVSLDGALHYQCIDWRHMGEMEAAGRAVYAELVNVCVWCKNNGGMGSFYRSQHELVFVWKVGGAAHLNMIELGRNGRYRTNVWNYPAPSRTGANPDLAMHPTVKPVPMIMDAIKDASRNGDIVLDPFGGSGSTLIAAHKTRRRARLIEYEPRYCEVTIRRWEKLTGKQAIHEETGRTFRDLLEARAADHAFDVATGLVIEGEEP